jgi:FkbM family methyltransferase
MIMNQKEVKIFGKTLKLSLRDKGDQAVADEVFKHRSYKLCEEAIRNAQGPIVDIGGHIGLFSLLASAMRPNLPIYSFEPHDDNFKLLKQNLKDNNAQNAKAIREAVSDQVGEADLILSQQDLNHSLTLAIEPTGKTQTVPTTTLERIFEQFKIDRCGLLKIDCEGSEYEILYSTPRAIFDKIQGIFLEYHEWSEKGLADALKIHLEKMGFRVKKIPNAKMEELGYLWATK